MNKPLLDTQVVALIVLVIGCIMLVVCKKNAIDTTVAGGIIGVASNMLTSLYTHKDDKQPTNPPIP